MKLSDIKDKLNADTISRRDGVITIRREFFYTNGFNSGILAERVRRTFPQATIIDNGEVWKPFNGAAPTARSSHWWVTFRLPEKESHG